MNRWHRTARRVFTAGALTLLASLLGGCGTYYSYQYAPEREIHDFRVSSDPDAAIARVSASLQGVMRPKSGLPRRVHARLVLDNRGPDPLTLRTQKTVLRPTTLEDLAAPASASDITVEPGRQRTVDLFFALPSEDRLPAEALEQLTLEWVLVLNGSDRTSQATFQRTYYSRTVYSAGYYGGYYGWGPGWYGWCHDPWYGFHGGYYRVIDCR